MDMFSGILTGFQQVMHPMILFYCFMGVLIGTLIGVLPGIGPVGAMSMLLPATFGMSPVVSIIVLAGIYYGSQYGGSTTSILVNVPGEASSIVTCLDGYQMARRGRAGVALGMSAFGSFIGGTFSIIALQFLVFPLANTALKFGPPEFFALMFLGSHPPYLPHEGLCHRQLLHGDPGASRRYCRYGSYHGKATVCLRYSQLPRRHRSHPRRYGSIRCRRGPLRS